MSVGSLLAPQTELQPWSHLYANTLSVDTLDVENLVVDGNLTVNGNLSVTGTTSLYTLATSGPITAGGVLNMAGSPIINAGSISSGAIESSGTISASAQSIVCYTNALAGSQTIPTDTVTPVTFLTNQIVSKGGGITWNPGSGTLVFNQSGFYSISVGLSWGVFSNAGGANIVQFYLLDVGPYIKSSISINQNGLPALTGSIQKQFSAGQTLTLNVFQNSSVSQILGDGNFASFISVYQLVQ
jgi:hypothetical protein